MLEYPCEERRGDDTRNKGREEGGREESCSAHPAEAPDTVKQRDEPPFCALFKLLILRIMRDYNNSYFLDFVPVKYEYLVNCPKI